MMSMIDLVAIDVETTKIDSGCSLQKEFTEVIFTSPLMVLYLIVN